MSVAAGKTSGVLAILGDRRRVILLLLLYCLAHLATRLALSPVFSLDEAEQMLFAQDLSLGYRFRHPPLITWLTWTTQYLFGLSGGVLFAMKYVVMFLGFVALFEAGRIILRDNVLAALATFAFMMTFTVGYYPHVDLMHTVLLMSLLAAAVLMLARVVASGRWSDYVLFGVVTAAGILAKYIFGVFTVAAIAAVLLTPEFRRRLDWRYCLLALVVALALLAPYAWWAMTLDYSLTELASNVTKSDASGLSARLEGTASLALSLLEFSLPFLAVFAAIFWPALLPIPPQREGADADTVAWSRVLGLTMIFGIAMMFASVLVMGASEFKARWMHQVLVTLPLFLFARLKLARPASLERRIKIYAGVAAAVVAVTIIARFASYELNAAGCRNCWEYQPFPAYANGLRLAGFTGGTIVVDDMYVGGNLRAQFPGSRVVTPGYPLSVFPPAGDGQCLVVWLTRPDRDKPVSAKIEDYLANVLKAEANATSALGSVTSVIDNTTDRRFTLNYRLSNGTGECR